MSAPAMCTSAHAPKRARCEEMAAEIATLREQVATLTAERRALTDAFDLIAAEVDDIERRLTPEQIAERVRGLTKERDEALAEKPSKPVFNPRECVLCRRPWAPTVADNVAVARTRIVARELDGTETVLFDSEKKGGA